MIETMLFAPVKGKAAVEREFLDLRRQERKLRQAAARARPAGWKAALEAKIPAKVFTGLESAFRKGFSVVFNQGTVIIEKGYSKESLQADQAIRDYAVQVKGGRKELRQMDKSARKADLLNLAATTLEGIGLGALGIGMPDIVLFLGTLLKGIYETALNYGFDYDSPGERLLILKMMETALRTGDSWAEKNAETDRILENPGAEVTEQALEQQIAATSGVFAMDMLLLKFIQGIPVVGIIGGAANPLYYRRIMKYVQLKYRKRYLTRKLTEL